MSDQPCENTDRELYREPPGDYYANSLHVTKGGGIGMNVGGFVIVLPLKTWHALASGVSPRSETAATTDSEVVRQLRNDVIEECAKKCESMDEVPAGYRADSGYQFAAALRFLKNAAPQVPSETAKEPQGPPAVAALVAAQQEPAEDLRRAAATAAADTGAPSAGEFAPSSEADLGWITSQLEHMATHYGMVPYDRKLIGRVVELLKASVPSSARFRGVDEAHELHELIEGLWWGDVEIVKVSTKTISKLKEKSAALVNLLLKSGAPSATAALSKGELRALIDYHSVNETEADAMDFAESAKHHEARRKGYEDMLLKLVAATDRGA